MNGLDFTRMDAVAALLGYSAVPDGGEGPPPAEERPAEIEKNGGEK